MGLYLRGSLAVGDFDPETSDIDIVVVTQKPISAREFDALRGAHERFRELPNPYAKRLEGSYIGCKAIKDFDEDEHLHPAFGTDSPLEWFNHRDNWIIEHHVVREFGVVILVRRLKS